MTVSERQVTPEELKQAVEELPVHSGQPVDAPPPWPEESLAGAGMDPGLGGQLLQVFPELDLVVAMSAGGYADPAVYRMVDAVGDIARPQLVSRGRRSRPVRR